MEARVRIKDVAELAGVSTATVSLVLNDVEGIRVAAATRERVRAAAARLGYRPNSLARSLRTRRTYTIGFISDEIATTPFAGQMIQGAEDAAWAAGYVLMLVNTGAADQLQQRAVQALLERQVDGLVFATMYHKIVELPVTITSTPVVVLDARPRNHGVPYVVPDEAAGAEAAVTELLNAGHRRIAHITDLDGSVAAGLRVAAYREALAGSGIRFDPRLVVRAVTRHEGGYRAASLLLAEPDRPTAIFCFNDLMAMGVYRAAAEHGLRIPDDLSVVGFDDQELIADALSPGLTTVALPHYAMGEWALRTLLRRIEHVEAAPAAEAAETAETAETPRAAETVHAVDGDGAARSLLMPCPLVRRESVSAPPERGPRRATSTPERLQRS